MIPVAAAAIMAGASLLGNAIQSANDADARAEARASLRAGKSSTDSLYSRMMGNIDQYYDDRGSMGSSSDVDAYKNLIAGYSPDSYVYTPDKFSYDKSAEDFMNPYRDQIIQDTAEQLQHTAAGSGLGWGTGAAYSIAKQVAEKNRELYNDAYSRYTDDRQFEYSKYNDYIQNMQNALAQKRAAMDTKVALTGNLANDYYSTMDAQQSDLLKAMQDRASANISYDTAMAGI